MSKGCKNICFASRKALSCHQQQGCETNQMVTAVGQRNVGKEGGIAELATKLMLFDIWVLTSILRIKIFLKI